MRIPKSFLMEYARCRVRYAPSLMSNPRYEIIHFVTGVADLVVEKCRTSMLHDDMTLGRLMVYAQSIEESKLRRMARSLKRSGASDKEQTRFKKKEGHKVRNCPMIASRGREGKQVSPSVRKDDALTKRCFYALCSRVERPNEKESDDDVGAWLKLNFINFLHCVLYEAMIMFKEVFI
ncbi:hypothetical protein EJD97_005871 [Solanum chilense]|uniref:Uncharacterized protein n=1 Tax=Solanum chilense TaxID=4083 RepID=A0A6N2ARE5_SOLCI|nr:hypothetical protein EJD97_005871 [Solanum chilense]